MPVTAREYFAFVARCVHDHRAAELSLEVGPVRGDGAGGGECDGPTLARVLHNDAARTVMRTAEETIGEALARIEGLRRVYARKADVIELRYVDVMEWSAVADELGVSTRTAHRWHDELCDWCDAVGWAHVRAGTGIASDA